MDEIQFVDMVAGTVLGVAAFRGAPRAEIFRQLPSISEETLASTLRAVKEAGMRVALLEELRDVDTIEDWREVEGRL